MREFIVGAIVALAAFAGGFASSTVADAHRPVAPITITECSGFPVPITVGEAGVVWVRQSGTAIWCKKS